MHSRYIQENIIQSLVSTIEGIDIGTININTNETPFDIGLFSVCADIKSRVYGKQMLSEISIH